ncbi:GTP-binding protein [Chamaesiphon sp. VAR_48_metabat_135_sub]|uniref:YcjF family protein n=1 Tax=Chamaesiphon sp. VAR_48_metabat_135_sub TaxID=2964699 RepID=UPI00286C0EB2|nr:GTP-binding protein [Chamaesiphon sp. VAR_48_metabat_135_sub]
MRLPRSWTIAIAVISTAILALWLINSIYALYVQVSWTTPWLATPILIGILLLIGIAIGAIIYYLGIFQGWWGKSSTKPPQLPKVPVEKTAAASVNLQAIDLQLQQIQDEVTRQALLAKSREIAENLARGQIRVVVFGTGSAGKTSLINAIIGRIVGEVGAPMGTTTRGETYILELKGLDRQILLTDTPGILEAGIAGTQREAIARELATSADLLLFVVDNDLRSSEYIPLMGLAEIGKRSLLIFNKTDLYPPVDRDKIVAKLQSRVQKEIESQDVIAIAANPQPVRLESGEMFTPDPDILPLVRRLAALLRAEGEDLIADNILLQSHRLGAEARELIDAQRRRQSERVVNRFQWIGAGVVTVTPLPVIDFLATAAINTQMIIEIGKIYGCDLNKETAQELALSLGKTLTSLGIVKGAIQLISTALTVNVATYALGKGIQGITAAYLTRIAGRSFIEYFHRDRSWGDGGMTEVVQQQFQLNRKDEFLTTFIERAIEKIGIDRE